MSVDPRDPVAALAAAILGLVFGSFANVCIYRLPLGESVISPRSRCPGCGSLIRWHDNIPIVSFILLGARCRSCAAPISWTYPIVEAVMGVGFLTAYLVFGFSLDAFAAGWLFFACVTLALIDLRHFLLPDLLTLTGIAGGLGFAAGRGVLAGAREGFSAAALLGGFFEEPVLPAASIAGAVAGAGIPLLARGAYIAMRRWRGSASVAGGEEPYAGGEAPGAGEEIQSAAVAEGMGMGDVKMLAMVGAFLGARMTLVTILIGSVLGCLVVLPWLALSRRGMKTPIPFGPFLAAGTVMALFAGEPLAAAYGRLIMRLFF